MIRMGTASDMGAILEIYNDAILHTTAVYTYEPFDLAYGQAWYAEKVKNHWPLLVYEEDGVVMAFATFGSFRDWPAYKYTIEHSIYVHPDYKGKGIATALMKALIRIANEAGYATLVAGIDADNAASIRLHEKLGFRNVGLITRAGFKFNHWLNLAFYQLDLDGPKNPTESNKME